MSRIRRRGACPRPQARLRAAARAFRTCASISSSRRSTQREAVASEATAYRCVERLDEEMLAQVRKARAEEHALVSERPQVAEAVAAVGEHHGQVARHAAGLVTYGPGVHGESPHEALREADGVGQTGEQGGA